MNPGRFFIPNTVPVTNPMIGMRFPTGNVGFLGKITNSLKAFSWSGFLNGTNKTLNVVNQAIPLIRQAGPMVNNMKSMMRVARMFGNETSAKNVRQNNISNTVNSTVTNKEPDMFINEQKEVLSNNYPNFFV